MGGNDYPSMVDLGRLLEILKSLESVPGCTPEVFRGQLIVRKLIREYENKKISWEKLVERVLKIGIALIQLFNIGTH
jgi:hypothetical protein